MASSALLHLYRSRASYSRNSFAAARMITSTSGSATAPWLMLTPFDNTGDVIWRFYCFAKNKIYSFFPEEDIPIRKPQHDREAELVGSSHGWLASHEKKCHLFLLNPITDRHIKLPPLVGEHVQNLILDDAKTKAFMIFGSGHSLAFCSLGSSTEWVRFGGSEYESIMYSGRHRRLFCITSTLKLEGWDVRGETPRLDKDWEAQLEIPILRSDVTKHQVYYIVCEEESGELFVVVRNVSLGRGGSRADRGAEREYVGPRVDHFEVYKIDDGKEEFKLRRMEGCLGGLTMFVGNNHPIVVKDVGGEVKPDSIYFGSDSRVRPYDGHPVLNDGFDYGIFDCRKGVLCRHNNACQLTHADHLAVWFTPRT